MSFSSNYHHIVIYHLEQDEVACLKRQLHVYEQLIKEGGRELDTGQNEINGPMFDNIRHSASSHNLDNYQLHTRGISGSTSGLSTSVIPDTGTDTDSSGTQRHVHIRRRSWQIT